MGGDSNNSGFVYNSQLDAFSLYHIVQDTPASFASSSSSTSGAVGPALPALGHALAGSLATASAKVLLYPLELVITRLQVQRQLRGGKEAESAAKDADQEYAGLIDAARKIYKTEGGLRAFYTGVLPDVGKGIADSFLFFLAYTFVRQRQLRKDGTKDLTVAKELAVGVAAGAFAKLLTTPIQNVVTRQQTAALVAARDPTSSVTPDQSDRLSMKDIALQIRSERGLSGFWAGYSASVILTLNPAITFAVDNFLKSALLPKSRQLNTPPQVTFLIAAVSKAVATTITYPVMLAKSRAQAIAPSKNEEAELEGTEKGSPGSPSATSRAKKVRQFAYKALRLLWAQYAVFVSLRKIFRQEGLAGLYSGLEGEVLKGFLSHGLTMAAKERVHVGVIQAYYLLLRITKRWPDDLQKAGESAKGVAADARERVGNIGVTVSEGAQQVIAEGRKAVGVGEA